ncbi:hypothetical protein FKM82_003912, partial [Ascaphus truei]
PVIMKCWKISLRSEFRDTKPGEYKESHQDFLDDSTTQFQIGIVFGQSTLEYVLNLCRGNIDFLERLPEPLVLYIAKFLDLEDIAQLSQVSRTLEKVKYIYAFSVVRTVCMSLFVYRHPCT